jgi:hypothetical protein
MKNNKINSALEGREYLIDQLKKQLIGPLNEHFTSDCLVQQFNPNNPNKHKQEITPKSPIKLYSAGILFPQKTDEEVTYQDESAEQNVEDDEEDSTINDGTNDENKDLNETETEEENAEEPNDNNLEIDLTNESKPSAMGVSVLVEVPEKLIISISDIGRYSKLGNDVPEALLVVSFYLSKFSKNKESYSWFNKIFETGDDKRATIHRFLENVFSIKESRIKNYEDYFDKYFDNRVGWKNQTNPRLDAIYDKLNNKEKSELEKEVKEIIIDYRTRQKQDISDDLAGFARESISTYVEFNKTELLNNNSKTTKNFFSNGEDIYLSATIISRPYNQERNKKYLTISIINTNKVNKKISTNKYFFQSNFQIYSEKLEPIFQHFDEINPKNLQEEEKSLYLLHHKRKCFAIGHGCAPNWELNDNNQCTKIKTEIIPIFESKNIRAKEFDDLKLNMKKFAEDTDFTFNELNKLIIKYENWLNKEKETGEKFENQIFKDASKKNIITSFIVLGRMKEGLEILKNNKNVSDAFKFMNKAMYLLKALYHIKKEKYNSDLNYEQHLISEEKGNWYPFQISFILINLKSLSDPLSDERTIMDLIWFPTGGGKTEAYLGLTAFTIFYRKINSKEAQGCAVIMRYTLRLLTTQQFQRASTLICACEKIRNENESILGKEIISIGLWIGGAVTPNKISDAKQELNRLNDSSFLTQSKFILVNCPWCNEEMGNKENEYAPIKGYKWLNNRFEYVCSNKDCYFSKEEKPLPITVIDEVIYEKIPSLIIGTIDKFAFIPWSDQAINIFNNPNNPKVLPPDLIIQDELHLISGPLGSVAGMYEILLTALCERNVGNRVINSKIIGSTATISRAKKQIRNLYGKDSSIFPPQTNQLDDSFFAYEDKKNFGRKYVGVFCTSATSGQVTLTEIISTMCLETSFLKYFSKNNINIYDGYWSHIVYFNSIRELMSGATLINADVKENIDAKYIRKGLTKNFLDENDVRNIRRKPNQISELNSRIESSSVPKILSDLFLKADNEPNKAVDICLSTNMIQVGIDIPRLGLISIVGQPKTTSEYIQASSRVGRGRYPGLVLTILSPFRPRDRSHYEKFFNYHENIYKFVEPTSITSNSDPVRKRCLHAIVIGLTRLWGSQQRISPTMPNKDLIMKIKNYIIKFFEKSDPDHLEEIKKTENEINYIFERWNDVMPQKYGSMSGITKNNSTSVLMIPSGSEKNFEGNPFETPTSMRSVDKECRAKILSSWNSER